MFARTLNRSKPYVTICRKRKFTTSSDPVGLVGIGKMGTAMAKNFTDAGYSLVVYDGKLIRGGGAKY